MKWIKIINPEIHKEELDKLIHFLDKNNFNYETDEKAHSQSVNQGGARELMIKAHNGYFGEGIDNPAQLKRVVFTGEELVEFIEVLLKLLPNGK